MSHSVEQVEVPTGLIAISGYITSMNYSRRRGFGPCKVGSCSPHATMKVYDTRGFEVLGTMPRNIESALIPLLYEHRATCANLPELIFASNFDEIAIEFTAEVMHSDKDDSHFGVFVVRGLRASSEPPRVTPRRSRSAAGSRRGFAASAPAFQGAIPNSRQYRLFGTLCSFGLKSSDGHASMLRVKRTQPNRSIDGNTRHRDGDGHGPHGLPGFHDREGLRHRWVDQPVEVGG
jgi:hypothetical protein